MRGIFNIVMRIVSSLIGVLMVVMGAIWTMQGLGIAPGRLNRGFMVNDHHWVVYGAILAIVGICQVIWSNTRQK
jgi:hypothetical protein